MIGMQAVGGLAVVARAAGGPAWAMELEDTRRTCLWSRLDPDRPHAAIGSLLLLGGAARRDVLNPRDNNQSRRLKWNLGLGNSLPWVGEAALGATTFSLDGLRGSLQGRAAKKVRLFPGGRRQLR